jgi:hypothetical protein
VGYIAGEPLNPSGKAVASDTPRHWVLHFTPMTPHLADKTATNQSHVVVLPLLGFGSAAPLNTAVPQMSGASGCNRSPPEQLDEDVRLSCRHSRSTSVSEPVDYLRKVHEFVLGAPSTEA